MASISSTGIGSGLDVESIVTKLMAVEKQPLTRLTTAAANIDTKISAYGTIKSQFSSLQDIATRLSSAVAWNAKTAASSNTTALTTSVSDATLASPTSFSIEVQQLAKAQSVASAALPTGTSAGTGTMTLQLGKWTSGSFGAASGSSPVTIEIGTGEDSVSAIASKINAADAGVVATVVTDTTGQRLLLRSKTTGESTGFRLQVADSDGGNADDAGLSRFAFDPGQGSFGMAGAAQASARQYGQNALATLNGISIVSESNTLSGTVPGMSMTLAQVTTAPVEVSVAIDNAAITKLANDFVTAYNATNAMLNDATKYDPSTKKANLLQGDSTTISLQNALRRMLGSRTEGGSFGTLSDIGITLTKTNDGSIALDSTRFSAALKKPADLEKLFTAATGDDSSKGFGLKLKSLMDTILGAGGAIDSKTQSLTLQKKSNSKDQDAMTDRLTNTEARLRKQYSVLDGQMASFTSLSNYITQQIAQWNKTS